MSSPLKCVNIISIIMDADYKGKYISLKCFGCYGIRKGFSTYYKTFRPDCFSAVYSFFQKNMHSCVLKILQDKKI